MSGHIIDAIRTITDETGHPPDADELAAALGLTTRQVQSFLIQPKRKGLVRYDDAGRFVLSEDTDEGEAR